MLGKASFCGLFGYKGKCREDGPFTKRSVKRTSISIAMISLSHSGKQVRSHDATGAEKRISARKYFKLSQKKRNRIELQIGVKV